MCHLSVLPATSGVVLSPLINVLRETCETALWCQLQLMLIGFGKLVLAHDACYLVTPVGF